MFIYISAFILGTILPIGVQKIFIYHRRFDDINHRSSHNTLATRTGGISIFLALFGITVFQYVLGEEIYDFSLLIPLSIMFIVGVYDDLYNADFKLKFLLQIVVAKILIDQGYVITNYHGLFGLNEVSWILAQLSTVFVFLVVVNAINFIDGIDGLAITEIIKTLLIIELFSENSTPLLPLGGIVILALIPLYYFNLRKSKKVFLGDAGSLFLGTLVLIYILHSLGPEYQLKSEFSVNKTFFSVIVLLYPLIDLIRVFILRIKDGKSPFRADKRHLHHLILNQTNNSTVSTLIIIMSEVLVFISLIGLF